MADAGEALLGPLRAELRRRACVAPEIPVVRAELGAHAGAVGAALWARGYRDAGMQPPWCLRLVTAIARIGHIGQK